MIRIQRLTSIEFPLKAGGIVLVGVMLVTVSGGIAAAQIDQHKDIVPEKITVDPVVFRPGQTLSVAASFTRRNTIGGGCVAQGITLRLYDDIEDKTVGELIFTGSNVTKPLVSAGGGPWDPVPPVGARAEVTFASFVMPQAGDTLSMVLWDWCRRRIIKGQRPDGTLIYQEKLSGSYTGGATFHRKCTGSGAARFCTYQSD